MYNISNRTNDKDKKSGKSWVNFDAEPSPFYDDDFETNSQPPPTPSFGNPTPTASFDTQATPTFTTQYHADLISKASSSKSLSSTPPLKLKKPPSKNAITSPPIKLKKSKMDTKRRNKSKKLNNKKDDNDDDQSTSTIATTPSAMIDLSLFEMNKNNISYDDSHEHYEGEEKEKEELGGIQYEEYDANDDDNHFEQYDANEDSSSNNHGDTYVTTTTVDNSERPQLSPSKSMRKMTKSFSSSKSMSLTSMDVSVSSSSASSSYSSSSSLQTDSSSVSAVVNTGKTKSTKELLREARQEKREKKEKKKKEKKEKKKEKKKSKGDKKKKDEILMRHSTTTTIPEDDVHIIPTNEDDDIYNYSDDGDQEEEEEEDDIIKSVKISFYESPSPSSSQSTRKISSARSSPSSPSLLSRVTAAKVSPQFSPKTKISSPPPKRSQAAAAAVTPSPPSKVPAAKVARTPPSPQPSPQPKVSTTATAKTPPSPKVSTAAAKTSPSLSASSTESSSLPSSLSFYPFLNTKNADNDDDISTNSSMAILDRIQKAQKATTRTRPPPPAPQVSATMSPPPPIPQASTKPVTPPTSSYDPFSTSPNNNSPILIFNDSNDSTVNSNTFQRTTNKGNPPNVKNIDNGNDSNNNGSVWDCGINGTKPRRTSLVLCPPPPYKERSNDDNTVTSFHTNNAGNNCYNNINCLLTNDFTDKSKNTPSLKSRFNDYLNNDSNISQSISQYSIINIGKNIFSTLTGTNNSSGGAANNSYDENNSIVQSVSGEKQRQQQHDLFLHEEGKRRVDDSYYEMMKAAIIKNTPSFTPDYFKGKETTTAAETIPPPPSSQQALSTKTTKTNTHIITEYYDDNDANYYKSRSWEHKRKILFGDDEDDIDNSGAPFVDVFDDEEVSSTPLKASKKERKRRRMTNNCLSFLNEKAYQHRRLAIICFLLLNLLFVASVGVGILIRRARQKGNSIPTQQPNTDAVAVASALPTVMSTINNDGNNSTTTTATTPMSSRPIRSSNPTEASPTRSPTPSPTRVPTRNPTKTTPASQASNIAATAADAITVGAYYYPWHGNNFHGGKYLREHLNQQPYLGEYDDSKPEVVAQHLEWSRQANIQLWITSWWGPNRREDSTTKDVILKHNDLEDHRIALLYETTGRIKASENYDTKRVIDDINYICDNYFDHPNYYRIDGRPVLFVYLTRKLEIVGKMEEVILLMKSAANRNGYDIFMIGDHVWQYPPSHPSSSASSTEVFRPFLYLDAMTNYDVYGSMSVHKKQKNSMYAGQDAVSEYYKNQRQWKVEANTLKCGYIPAVSPGYNDRAVRLNADHLPLSRKLNNGDDDYGSLFKAQLEEAKKLVDKSMNNLLLVNSFNEWHEDTQIEPAISIDADDSRSDSSAIHKYTKGVEYQGYGDLYLNILGDATKK